MFNTENLPDGTQLRFLDMPAFEHRPMTAEQQSEFDAIWPKACELAKDCTVPAYVIEQGECVKRVQVTMRRTTLDKINAIAKGEQ